MGLLALISRAAVGFLICFNWLYAFLSRRYKIHRARFARVDELAKDYERQTKNKAAETLIKSININFENDFVKSDYDKVYSTCLNANGY